VRLVGRPVYGIMKPARANRGKGIVKQHCYAFTRSFQSANQVNLLEEGRPNLSREVVPSCRPSGQATKSQPRGGSKL